MKNIRLINPTVELKSEYMEMLKDWENHNEKPKPWILKLDTSDFQKMIKTLEGFSKGIGLKEGQVEHTTYWLVENNTIIGAVNIRHRLNERLLKYDGHIGGGIRPSYRGKGYGKIMLSLALGKTKELGINRVLLTCNVDNYISERTIISNGGVFESEETEENGNVVRRFWIEII